MSYLLAITTKCESKKVALWSFLAFFPKRLGIFPPNFTWLLYVPTYARLQICIQLSATLTKLCHIKRDHPVHIICAKCPPLAETHAGIFWHFPKQLGIFSPNFTCLLYIPIYARRQIFIQSPTVTKLCHTKCDHPACVSADGGYFEHIIWWRLIWHNFIKVADNWMKFYRPA